MWAKYIPLLVFEAREHPFPLRFAHHRSEIRGSLRLTYSCIGADFLQVYDLCSVGVQGFGTKGPFPRW